MRQSLVVLGLGLLALWTQGTVASFSPELVPDLGFLVVVAAGLYLRSAEGLLVSAGLGFAADLLSGSLLGQHALLRVLAFAATRLANLHLNLLRRLPRVVFVGALTLADGLALLGLTRLFSGSAGLGLAAAGSLLLHAGLNALLAPLLIPAVHRAVVWARGDEEAGRRPLRLEGRAGA